MKEICLDPEILKKNFPESFCQYIEEVRKKDNPESYLIAVLHKAQKHFGYLSDQTIVTIAYLMQIPSAKVSGVASFYHYFQLKQPGKLIISVCLGTACHVKGADLVAKKIQEELGIHFGETTKDGFFTLEATRCLGACALAPIVKIGDTIHAHVTPDQIPALLEKYFQKKNF